MNKRPGTDRIPLELTADQCFALFVALDRAADSLQIEEYARRDAKDPGLESFQKNFHAMLTYFEAISDAVRAATKAETERLLKD